jgi:hypothetical protein
MKLTKRRWFGLALICLAYLTGVIIQFTTGKLIKYGLPKLDAVASGGDKVAAWTETSYSQDEQINFHIFIPLASCLAVGVICLAWPIKAPKKPPLLSN